MKYVYVVHEIEGSHILRSFLDEQDALSFLHWEEVEGNIMRGYYKISKVEVR